VTPQSLTAWRQRLGLTKVAAAEALGCSRDALLKWEQGEHPVPRYIALACAAIAHGLPAIS
jgi:DNA-binding transcriptional regulator YiaG